MDKLEHDTRLALAKPVSPTLSHFEASLHPDWQVWFPNGGYMGAILLRAASEVSSFELPLSFHCHFVSVPAIGAVEIDVTSLRRTRYAESLSMTMRQGEKIILQALVWFGTQVEGYVHDNVLMPEVPAPAACKATTEIEGAHAHHPFWKNFEQRPTTNNVHWQISEVEKATQRDWIQFSPYSKAPNICLDMMRYVIVLDTYVWPAAARAHPGDGRYIAPTLSLNIDFHRHYAGDWLLSDASAPIASNGYMAGLNRLWSEQGDLLATASATLMCRPRPAGV